MSKGFVFFIIVALVIGVGLWGYIGSDGQQTVKNILTFQRSSGERIRLADVTIGGVTVRADVAETPETRARGLSGRSSLGELEGMLFLFDQPGLEGFWMKDMLIPIDIIWINDGAVVDILANAQPASEAIPPTFVPKAPANRVLEVPAGFAARHNIGLGSPVTIRFDGFRTL